MRRTVYRWFEQHRWAGDAILASLALIALLVNAAQFRSRSPLFLVMLAGSLPLYLRRSRPEWAVCLGVLLLLANLRLFDLPTVEVGLAPVLVHTAVAHAPQRFWGRIAVVLGLLGSAAGPLRWGYGAGDPAVLAMAVALCAISVVAAFVIGERQRDRREHQAEQLQAMTERLGLLAAEREQRAGLAAANERARIARELHDVVAHSLSVVIVQADGGAAAAANRPELAVQVLQTIAKTSREALGEMRRLVGVLRSGPAAESAVSAESGADVVGGYRPAPGTADLAALVDQVRLTGTGVELRVSGPSFALPPGLDLTVYRLVQEGLTNVLRHAGPVATALVEVIYHPGPVGGRSVEVGVTDDGRGNAVNGDSTGDEVFHQPGGAAGYEPGHGLAGMRERVSLQDGRLTVGPRVGGGFAVRARFPVPEGFGQR